ncbi:MAG: ATP-binding cassette domain-containing protein, partial [Actinomycetes bacterium]
RDVDFAVAPGEVVAIVGASGAGKSTIAQLVPRLYDPDEGAVLVDGMDVRSVTLESLRGQVSLVLQDTVLLTGTVGENIAYGVEHATQDSIVAAARAANAHDFIEALPQGYDTVLGERGATVSGGQRQRIAIARAFIRETPILILDEPTTGLDTESTRLVVEALHTLMNGRTTIIISHDESLIRSADRVLVIDEGRIASTGPGELSGEPDVDSDRHMHTKQAVEVRVKAAMSVVVAEPPTVVPASVRVAAVPAADVAGRTPVETAAGGNGHRPANGSRPSLSRQGTPPTPPVRGLAEALAAHLPGLSLALREDFAAEQIERLLLDCRSGQRVDGVRAGTFWVHRDGTCSLRYDVRIVDPYGRARQQTVLGRVHGDGEAAACYLDDRVRPVAARARDSVRGGPWREWAAVAPEAGLGMHPLPVDPDLPSLVGASDPTAMAGVLGRLAARTGRARVFGRPGVDLLHHPRFGPGVLRYDLHPGAAAVSDADDLPVYGKVYPPGQGDAPATKARSLYAASRGTGNRGLLQLPRPLGWLPDLDLLLTETIPSTDVLSGLVEAGLQSGTANVSGLGGSDLSESVAEAGRVLAALHRTSPPPDLPVRTLAEETTALRREHTIVADIWPGTAEQIWAAVSGQLDAGTATPAGPLVLCHGDFTPDRVLTGPVGMAVVDLDAACLGEPALDLGRFLAALDTIGSKVGGDASLPMLSRLTSTFLLAYAMASRPAVHLDLAMRARIAAVRAASHARTALHACRQMNEHRVRSDHALLTRSRDLSRRGQI